MSEENEELDRQSRDFGVLREVYMRWDRGDFTYWEAFADDYVWEAVDAIEPGAYTGIAEVSARPGGRGRRRGMDSASRRRRCAPAPTASMW